MPKCTQNQPKQFYVKMYQSVRASCHGSPSTSESVCLVLIQSIFIATGSCHDRFSLLLSPHRWWLRFLCILCIRAAWNPPTRNLATPLLFCSTYDLRTSLIAPMCRSASFSCIFIYLKYIQASCPCSGSTVLVKRNLRAATLSVTRAFGGRFSLLPAVTRARRPSRHAGQNATSFTNPIEGH